MRVSVLLRRVCACVRVFERLLVRVSVLLRPACSSAK